MAFVVSLQLALRNSSHSSFFSFQLEFKGGLAKTGLIFNNIFDSLFQQEFMKQGWDGAKETIMQFNIELFFNSFN
jgi:hypothetical protein